MLRKIQDSSLIWKYIYVVPWVTTVILYYNILIINTITYYLVHVRGARIDHWSRGGLKSPGVPGSSPAAAEIFPFCTHNAVTQTVQIRGIVIATERIFDSRRLKKRTQKKQIKMSKLTCERSKKPLKKTLVLAGNGLLQTNEIISS